jgi:hypothetical protein
MRAISTLPLLVLGVRRADHVNNPTTTDDFAMITNLLDR